MTTLFRVIMVIPIGIVSAVLTAGATQTVYNQSGQVVRKPAEATLASNSPPQVAQV